MLSVSLMPPRMVTNSSWLKSVTKPEHAKIHNLSDSVQFVRIRKKLSVILFSQIPFCNCIRFFQFHIKFLHKDRTFGNFDFKYHLILRFWDFYSANFCKTSISDHQVRSTCFSWMWNHWKNNINSFWMDFCFLSTPWNLSLGSALFTHCFVHEIKIRLTSTKSSE